uniref:Phosphoglucosamine mutase n=1 Tax=candidate division WOR-3 bacterium TaxID=2052148 RepID=A0A7V3VUY1_UNCW3
MPLILTISGLRGIADKDLIYDTVNFYTKVFKVFLDARKMVVGYDTRKSNYFIKDWVVDTLNFMGCSVIDLGIVPTPTTVFMVRKLKVDGGIMITASHNPPEWNGFKFIAPRGEFINTYEFHSFLIYITYFKVYKWRFLEFKKDYYGEHTYYKNAYLEHIEKVLKHFRLKNLNLRVGVDAVCSTGSLILPQLLEMAGCKVYKINCTLKNRFPRPPEPTPENITQLCNYVKYRKLDLGFALDPDGDRLSIVDDKGNAIGEEKTLVLATDFILGRERGPVVTNLSTTSLMEYITNKHKCPLYRTKVGEVNVVSKMNEVKAVIGGEGNGGVIYPVINRTRDAITAAGIILKLLKTAGKPLSEIVNSYPDYFMLKDKVEIPSKVFEERKELIIKKIKGKLDSTDGIRITTPKYWIHIRPSNTEPIVRIIAEAKSKEKALELIALVKEILAS